MSGERVMLKPGAETRTIVAYSSLYGVHPRVIVATTRGRFKRVSEDSDAYTGKSNSVLQHRRELIYHSSRLERLQRQRSEALSSYLKHGALWERSCSELPTMSLQESLSAATTRAGQQNI